MSDAARSPGGLDPETRAFYIRALDVADASGVPYLIGGAYAMERYTGVERHTKDLDLFLRPGDRDRMLAAFARAGYRAERTFPHWLAKIYSGDAFVDLIYRSGNGVSEVTDAWFAHAVAGEVLGRPARLCPAEEILWTKAYLQERERYDGADVAHLLRARAESLDWSRLVASFGPGWRVLLAHLVLFGFIYPDERDRIPAHVLDELLGRLRSEAGAPPAAGRVCRGTLLSRAQYLVDLDHWGYRDARLRPLGSMTEAEIAYWTAAIDGDPGPAPDDRPPSA